MGLFTNKHIIYNKGTLEDVKQKEGQERMRQAGLKHEAEQRRINPNYDKEQKIANIEASKRARERMEADNKLKAQRAAETRRLNKLHGVGTHGVKAAIEASKKRVEIAREKVREQIREDKSKAINNALNRHK